MGKFKDLTGQRFGRLTVIERAETDKQGKAQWLCKCDCGEKVVVRGNLLLRGNTKSCGCLQRERTAETFLKDLTGKKFGRLTVLERVENDKDGAVKWLCRCECGRKVVVRGGDLRSGRTQSCGCLNREKIIQRKTKHGLAHEKTYNIWLGIKQRCFYPKNKSYKRYGGRGITLYEPWIHDFKAFYDYVSKLPHFGEKGYTIDRINVNGNYEPNNLRYATDTEQQRNRRDNIIVEYQEQKMTLTEAAEKCGINYFTLKHRYHRGETGDRLFRPVETKHRRKK